MLALVLTILFSSPDEKPSTVQSWARTDPVDFVTTATTELDGSSGTGTYGPPYNHASDGQHILFIRPQKWLGVSHPVDTAQDFVLAPLRSIIGQPGLQAAVTAYESASSAQQAKWTTAYENGLAKANPSANNTAISVPAGSYGPLPTMMGGLLGFAQSGGLDGALLTSRQFYQTDYTKPLLFMADGGVSRTGLRPSTYSGASGDDERNGQLSRTGVAMALHVLVSDQAVLDLGQR